MQLGLFSTRRPSNPGQLRNRGICVLLTLIGCLTGIACVPLSLAQKQPNLPYSLSELESFLKAHDPNGVTVHGKNLGILSLTSEASFAVIVAWAPKSPEIKFSGLRISLRKPVAHASESVYLDADSLGHIDQLRSLARRKNAVVNGFKGHEPPDMKWAELTSVNCRWNGPSDPSTSVLNIGWFGDSDTVGVIIRSRRSGQDYQFPGAELSSIVEILDAGRTSLRDLSLSKTAEKGPS